MLIEVVGGQLFLAHRVTGGLSKNEYARSNVGTLFPELMDSKDDSISSHHILKGFQVDTDARGYTSLNSR